MSFVEIPVSPEGNCRSSISNKSSLGSSHATSLDSPLDLKFPSSSDGTCLSTVPVSISNKTAPTEINIENSCHVPSQGTIPSVRLEPTPTLARLKLLKKSTQTEIESLLLSTPLKSLREWCETASVIPHRPLSHKKSFSLPLSAAFWSLYCHYAIMDIDSLRSAASSIASSNSLSADGCLYDILRVKFPTSFLHKIMRVRDVNRNLARRTARSATHESKKFARLVEHQSIVDSWPSLPSEEFILERCSEYIKATSIKPPAPCVCCGRSFLRTDLIDSFCFSLSDNQLSSSHPLHMLHATESLAPFFTSSVTQLLDGIMIHHEYITFDSETSSISLLMCHECDSSLKASQLPRFSLKNDLWRGKLPPELQDISWIDIRGNKKLELDIN